MSIQLNSRMADTPQKTRADQDIPKLVKELRDIVRMQSREITRLRQAASRESRRANDVEHRLAALEAIVARRR